MRGLERVKSDPKGEDDRLKDEGAESGRGGKKILGAYVLSLQCMSRKEFPSSSHTIQHCLIFKKYFVRNDLYFTHRNAFRRSLKEQLHAVVAYRRSPSLWDLLVRATVKDSNSTLKTLPGTFCCKSKHGCLTCPHIDNGHTTYTFTSTGEKSN